MLPQDIGEPRTGAAQGVLHVLTYTSGATRAEIADALGMPNPTVVTATARLVQAGVLEEFERPRTAGGAGRRPRALRLAGVVPVLGVLTWGLHGLTASLVSFAGDTVAESEHAVAVRPQDLAELYPALDFLTTEASVVVDGRSRRLTAIVLAVLSAPTPVGTAAPWGAPGGRAGRFGPWLRPADLEELSAHAGVPVLVEKSANLAALAEHAHGAGVGHQDLFLVSFSRRGVNGGLVLNGTLYRGTIGFAGEVGHVQVDEPGALCGCGGRGCLVGRLGDHVLAPLNDIYGRVPPIDEVVDLARADEPAPIRVLTELGRMVGRSVADVCTVLNPSMVIVGGPVGSPTPFVADGVREQIDRHCPPAVSHAVTVTTAALGPRAEVLGALQLARAEL